MADFKATNLYLSHSDYTFQLSLIGEVSVGKWSLVLRFLGIESITQPPYLDSNTGAICSGGLNIVLKVWSTASADPFSVLPRNMIIQLDGAAVVFDVTSRPSFDRVPHWVERMRCAFQDIGLVLVGNKCELEDARTVTPAEGAELAGRLSLPYIETSAATGLNVNEMFDLLSQEVVVKVRQRAEGHLQGAYGKD